MPSGLLERGIVPLIDKNGKALDPAERLVFANTEGRCEHCGEETHKQKRFSLVSGRWRPLTNDRVYKGICIQCHPNKVPETVLREFKLKYPPSSLMRRQIRESKGKNQRRTSPTISQNAARTTSPASERSNGQGTKVVKPTVVTKQKKNSKVVEAEQSSSLSREPSLTVFQASPLAYEDFSGTINPIPFIDLQEEKDILKEALAETSITVAFQAASANTVGTFLSQGNSLLHLSCHGHPDYLLIEDGYGGGQRLLVDENLKGWIRAGGQQLDFVFVSACHSRSAGQAFVEAGVSHVVCCESNEDALSNTAAMVFSRDFYRAIGNGRTVQQAYDLAIYAVIHSSELQITTKRRITGKEEASKFALLPEENVNHDVRLFPKLESNDASLALVKKQISNRSRRRISNIPIPPQIFLGREVDLYNALRSLFVKKARLLRLTGIHQGIGKFSFAKALCQYMDERRMWGSMHFLQSTFARPKSATVADHWTEVFSLITDEGIPFLNFESNTEFVSKCQNLFDEFSDKKAIIFIDAVLFPEESILKLRFFLDAVFERSKYLKVVLLYDSTSRIDSFHPSGFHCIDTELSLPPLAIESTIILFGKVCPHAMSDKLWNKSAETLKRSKDAFRILGEGIPAKTLLIAKTMTKDEYDRLVTGGSRDSIVVSDFEGCIGNVEGKLLPVNFDYSQQLLNSYRNVDLAEDDGDSLVKPHEPPPPPPLRTQAEVFKHFSPLLRKEGTIFRKNVSCFVRKAIKGEHIVTTIDGQEETQYKIENENSWVACGKAAGEHYVLSDKQFRDNYDTANPIEIPPSDSAQSNRLRQKGFFEYNSRRQVWARKVDEQDMSFFRHGLESSTTSAANEAYFMAPWGESMLVQLGDYLVMQYPGDVDEIYRIEYGVFGFSYTDTSTSKGPRNDEVSPMSPPPLQSIASALTVVAIVGIILQIGVEVHRIGKLK